MKRKKDYVSRQDLILAVSEKTGFTKKDIKNILNCTIEEIKEQYRNGKNVEIRGFGTFIPYLKKAYVFKVPRTGRTQQMRPRTMLKFKSSPKLLIVH